jgi:hypothetical protein
MSNEFSERDVVTQLEHGDTSHLSTFFQGKFEEERLTSVNVMKGLYDADVKAGIAPKGQLDINESHWWNENIAIDVNGKSAYGDSFDLRSLKHSDPNDVVPENRTKFDMGEIQQVTKQLELGDPSGLDQALQGKYVEEAASCLKQVVKTNEADLAQGLTHAALYLNFDDHKMFPMNVSVARSMSGFWNAFSNPSQLYEKGWDETLRQQFVRSRTDDRK